MPKLSPRPGTDAAHLRGMPRRPIRGRRAHRRRRYRRRSRPVASDARVRGRRALGHQCWLCRRTSPKLRVGNLVLGQNHSDPGLLNVARLLLENERPHLGTLLTQTAALETVAGKAALHAATGALAVDMETAWIAGVCAGAGVPLLSLRVISDAAAQSFPVPGHVLFDAARQRPRYVALPLWLLSHPSQIPPFAAFVRGLAPARVRLTRALEHLVSHI